MIPLSAAERKLLLEIVAVKDAPRELNVVRHAGKPAVTLNVGKKRFESDQSIDALSVLYSRGLVRQSMLNRFVLTDAGQQMVRDLAADES